ncbi:hypothetical protein, partial [Erwinia sp. OPT-41]
MASTIVAHGMRRDAAIILSHPLPRLAIDLGLWCNCRMLPDQGKWCLGMKRPALLVPIMAVLASTA